MSPFKSPDWIKAATAIKTTDTFTKVSKRVCKIDNAEIEIVGIAKGSGMIAPNLATMLSFIFTDADIPNDLLKKLLKKNISNTFNAITCDGDTSTNDMVSIFSINSKKSCSIALGFPVVPVVKRISPGFFLLRKMIF